MSLTVGAFDAKTKFSELLDLEHLRGIADRYVEEFGRPFKSTDVDALLYDEDGLPK